MEQPRDDICSVILLNFYFIGKHSNTLRNTNLLTINKVKMCSSRTILSVLELTAEQHMNNK